MLPWIPIYLTIQYYAVAMGTSFNNVFLYIVNLMTKIVTIREGVVGPYLPCEVGHSLSYD